MANIPLVLRYRLLKDILDVMRSIFIYIELIEICFLPTTAGNAISYDVDKIYKRNNWKK